jgi:hypothetical protein
MLRTHLFYAKKFSVRNADRLVDLTARLSKTRTNPTGPRPITEYFYQLAAHRGFDPLHRA